MRYMISIFISTVMFFKLRSQYIPSDEYIFNYQSGFDFYKNSVKGWSTAIKSEITYSHNKEAIGNLVFLISNTSQCILRGVWFRYT